MKKTLLLIVLTGCGKTSPVTAPFALTLAQCPSIPLAGAPPLQAHVTIEGMGTPCELTVSKQTSANFPSGGYTASGDCPNIPAVSTNMVLDWYVTAPLTGKEVILAEAAGVAALKPSSSEIVAVAFNQAPKTKAASSDSASERDRFNCDRTGVYACDSGATADPNAADTDTCSNLEEYCANTLFVADHLDACP